MNRAVFAAAVVSAAVASAFISVGITLLLRTLAEQGSEIAALRAEVNTLKANHEDARAYGSPSASDGQVRTLSAEQLQIVGPDGKRRVVIGPTTLSSGQVVDGSFRLSFYDGDGRERIGLSTFATGDPVVNLWGKTGPGQLQLLAGDSGPVVSLSGKGGLLPRLYLSADETGPEIRLNDLGGRAHLILSALGGEPGLTLYDKKGRERLFLGNDDATSDPYVLLLNADGKPLSVFP